VREEFTIERHGKSYVLFAGLLDEAHSQGLKSIDTELLQPAAEENGSCAVVKATVEMEDGRTFTGIGDASPDNVGRTIIPHLIRMAETRSKARALRDAVNVGAAVLEELSEGDDNHSSLDGSSRSQQKGELRAVEESEEDGSREEQVQKVTEHQISYLRALAEKLRGEDGVERLEKSLGHPLEELSRDRAQEWIEDLEAREK